MSTANKDRLSISIEQDKKEKFKQWCQQNKLNMSDFLNQFIDSCLGGGNLQFFSNSLLNNEQKTEQKIKSIVENAIAPLQQKINELEIKLQSKSSYVHSEVATVNTLKLEISTENEDNQEKRKYLTRTEAWQKLKQTNYIKTNGYDSFLRTTPAEFPLYDIYYDVAKKRYYIIEIDEE